MQIVGEPARSASEEKQQQPSREKPDLLLTTAYHSAAELLTDVVITHPATATALADKADERPLRAARTAETRKLSKYGHLVLKAANGRSRIRDLKPFAMESMGAFGKHANDVLKIMMKHAAHNAAGDTPLPHEARIRLSIALQRGNALIARHGVEMLCSTRDEAPQLQPHRCVSHASRQLGSCVQSRPNAFSFKRMPMMKVTKFL